MLWAVGYDLSIPARMSVSVFTECKGSQAQSQHGKLTDCGITDTEGQNPGS